MKTFDTYEAWQTDLKAEDNYKKKDDRNITIIITLSVLASALFYTILIIKIT